MVAFEKLELFWTTGFVWCLIIYNSNPILIHQICKNSSNGCAAVVDLKLYLDVSGSYIGNVTHKPMLPVKKCALLGRRHTKQGILEMVHGSQWWNCCCM